MPSAVFADPGEGLQTGRDAVFSARLAPERLEPNPKLRVDDGSVHRGTDVADHLAAVFGRVATEAHSAVDGAFDRVTVTHPAGWEPRRPAVIREAANRAGLGAAELIPEPTAAARYFRGERRDTAVSEDGDQPAMIYDLGAETFDVSVVAGSRVLAFDGLADVGGPDVDVAVSDSLGRVYGAEGANEWKRLTTPTTRQTEGPGGSSPRTCAPPRSCRRGPHRLSFTSRCSIATLRWAASSSRHRPRR